MQDKNIFGLPVAKPDALDEQLKGLQTQKENLQKRLLAEGIDPDTLGGDFDNRNLLEKALNLTPDQGVLMDFFEILNRPVEAVKGALTAGYDEQSVLEGAWEGISGQKVTKGRELFGLNAEDDLGVGGFILDVGTDIALDPLTYLPAGFFLKGFKKATTRTTTRVFQTGQIKLDRVVKEVLQEYGDEGLELAYKNGNDSRIFKLGKNDYGQFVDSNLMDDIGYFAGPGKKQLKQRTGRQASKEIAYLNGPRLERLAKGIGSGAQKAEYEGLQALVNTIESFGDDIKVVTTSTKDTLDDIIILKRYGDTDYWVNIGNFDSKFVGQRVSQGAFGKNTTLRLVQKTVGGPAALDFAEKSPLAKLDPEFKERFFTSLEKIRTKDNSTIGAKIRTNIANNNGYINFGKEIVEADLPLFKNLFFEYYQKAGLDLIYATDLAGNGRFFKLSDVYDELDFTKTEFFVKSKTAAKTGKTSAEVTLKGGFFVDLKKVEQTGKYMLTEDIGKKLIEDSMEVNVTFLEDLAKRGDFVGKSARALQTVGETIGTFFNETFNFSEFAKMTQKYIIGESNLFVQRQSARLAVLRQDLISRFPNAGEYLTELFESGAYIDEASGAVRTLDREMHIQDFMGYVMRRVNDGTDIPLPRLIGTNTKKNFTDFLNGISEDVTGRTLFEVIEKGKATGLRFTGSLEELKDINKHLKFTNYQKPFVKFGNAPLSAGAEAMLKADPESFKKAASLMDDVLSTLVKEGGFSNIVPELTGQIGYMRHLMTKGAYEAMQMNMPGVLGKYAKPGMDVLKQRTFMGSVDEVNAALKEFYKMDQDFFTRDAFEAMENLIKVTSRKVEQRKMLNLVLTAKDRYGEQMFKVVDNLASVKKNLRPGDIMIKSFEDEFPALIKNLSPESQKEFADILAQAGFDGKNKAIVMNRNAHGLIKRSEKAYQEIPKLIKVYDGFLNTWKGLTLISPGFHMRNLFGNMFNSYAVGMDLASQSEYGLIAMREMNEYHEIVRKVAQGSSLTNAEQKVFDKLELFNSMGLVQSHRGVRDLEQVKEATELALKENQGFVKNTYNNAIRFNFNVAEKMDDVQRYMLFRWALDKTGDANKAARTVTESLFDYQHLTNFEKDVMKRVFPFYTFMKNNFIFQAKNIFRNPKLYARTGRAYKYYLEDIAGYSAEDLPDYATENMWLPIPITVNKNDKKAIAFLKANLPLADFTELVENPFKKGVVSLSTPLKLPIELGIGRDLFTGAPLSAFPGERNKLAEKTGVLGFLRDERGNLAITQMPLVQKIASEVGLRTPLNYGSVGLDALDTLLGYQGPKEGLADFAQRLGLVGVQEMDKLEITTLYQELERLRELKKYYEQETGNQLPLLPRS